MSTLVEKGEWVKAELARRYTECDSSEHYHVEAGRCMHCFRRLEHITDEGERLKILKESDNARYPNEVIMSLTIRRNHELARQADDDRWRGLKELQYLAVDVEKYAEAAVS